jgi:hypothetical protein
MTQIRDECNNTNETNQISRQSKHNQDFVVFVVPNSRLWILKRAGLETVRVAVAIWPCTCVTNFRSDNSLPVSNLRHTTSRYTYIKYVLSHTINYQRVSIALAIVIIRAAVQQHKQYNKLPNYVSGTTQTYNKCLKCQLTYCLIQSC